MGLGRKIAGLFLALLILTYEFHGTILVLASTNSQTGSYMMAGDTSDIEFLRRQLEKAIPSEDPLLERSYVIPSGMNLSLADEIWLKIAPLISLGYSEKEIVKAVGESSLPDRLEADGASVLLNYANLHVTRSLENGEVSVEIPVLCNSSLSSVYYEVKGVKKHIKLYNVTSIRYYNVSVRASDLYDVTYSSGETDGFYKAILDLKGDLKNNVVNAYFPNLEKPVFSEICFNLPSYGVTLSLRVLELKVYDIGSSEERVDCFWIHVNATLRAARDVWCVMFRIGRGGGWVNKPWLILRKGEYASDHWVKWTPSDKLIVDFNAEGFGNRFILDFDKTLEMGNDFLSRVLSEDELKSLLEQPPYVKLNLSRVLKGWNVTFVGEKVTNETVWVTNEEYEQLARFGWRKDNSIFVDSGEIEWEYAVTNRTLGQCESIRLFYNPLKANRGELVHGLTLRNYANANVSYTLRLRTITSFFFFFSKVEEGNGGITLNKSSISHLLLVQQEPAVGDAVLELVNDGRVVAAVKVYLTLKATMYWKGFWEGLASKLPGIMITAGVMVAMGFLIPHAYIRPAYYLLLGLGVLMNLAEVALDIAEANRAKDEMLALAEAFENRSREFLAGGEVEHASECVSFALALRKEVNETINNLLLNVLSDLAIGVSFDEIRIALGLREPLARDELERQYKIGYARGRVTGAVISCVLYITLFIMVNRIKVERAGQRLTADQVLKLIAKGIYNWITPTIWDAIVTGLGRIKGFAERAVDLLLANKYSRRFGDIIGNIVESVKAYSSKVDDALDALSGLSKQVLENVPSKENSRKILDIIGSMVERYSLEELKEKGGTVARSVISIWIKDGDEAIDYLNSWLSANSKDLDKMEALNKILAEIGGDATKGVGLKIGEIVDNHLNIKSKYGEGIANILLGIVLKNPNALDVLKDPDALDEFVADINGMKHYEIDYGAEHRKVTLSRGEGATLNLGMGYELEPGIYKAVVCWEGSGKSGGLEFAFSKDGKTGHVWIPKGCVDEILGEIGSDEATVSVTSVKIFEYVPELHHPTRFFPGGTEVMLDLINNKITVYDEFNGRMGLPIESRLLRTEEGKAILEVTTGARNMQGKPLTLAFYDDGEVKIRLGDDVYSITSIKVNRGRWIIEYPLGGKMHTSTSILGKPISVPERLTLAEDVSDVKDDQGETIKLKERIFMSGYYVETLNKVGSENTKERLLLKVYFSDDSGNYRISYCCNPDLAVEVPEGITKIEYVEVLNFLATVNDLEECIRMSKQYPFDDLLKGQIGELIVKTDDAVNSKLSRYLDEISEKTGISRDKIRVEWHGWAGDKGPDFRLIVTGDIIDKHGNLIKAGSTIIVGEIKSTLTHSLVVFERGIDNGKDQLIKSFAEIETARYGILIVLDYDIENPSGSKPYTFPLSVGDYENPYIEIIERGG
ncbi:MAG: hypothetical protein QW304_07075 [Thermoproteota archaeon]